ncbi:HBL/NHE enterotoxin family protein [Bacillus toyonensis]|uniref:HBL/NHE enterotoxin family protein n=1 Tax=Bacillus toyonensis TaxID=155322 RepID=UPI000BFCA7B1|nr:HBL/NHE enterotoxin family protein [Bacillus toyonensis]PHG62747.1 hypothetical protein COI59_19860 [Bacillus toyonensis]
MKKVPVKVMTCSAVLITLLATHAVPGYVYAAPSQSISQNATADSGNDSLVPGELEKVLAATGSHIAVLDTYSLLVKNQEPFDFSNTSVDVTLRNKIEKDQKQAKTNATTWLDTVKPQIIQTNENIFSFGTKFQNYYQVLINAVDTKNTKNLKTGIGLLYKDIQENQKSVTQLIQVLTTFRDALIKDGENFKQDASDILQFFEGNNGRIKQLQDLILQYQQNIEAGTIMVKEGAAKAPLGVGFIIIGAILTALEDTTGITFSTVGMGLNAEAAALIENGIKMINKSKEGLNKAFQELRPAEGQVGNLSLNKDRLQTFVKEIDIALSSAQSILNQWNAMGIKYEALLNKIENAKPEDLLFIKSQLNTTKKSWDDIQVYADKLYSEIQYKS